MLKFSTTLLLMSHEKSTNKLWFSNLSQEKMAKFFSPIHLKKKMIFCYYPFQEKVTTNCDTLVHLKKKCEKTYCFPICLQIQIPINKDDAILVKLEWQRSTTRAKIKYHVEGHFIHRQKEWLPHNNISSCHFQFLTFWDHKQSKEETHR
jgi:hypothetical protein